MNTKWAADMIYLGKKSVCHNSFQSLELPWGSKINFYFVFVVTSDILLGKRIIEAPEEVKFCFANIQLQTHGCLMVYKYLRVTFKNLVKLTEKRFSNWFQKLNPLFVFSFFPIALPRFHSKANREMILRKQRDWVIHPQEQRLVEKFKIY